MISKFKEKEIAIKLRKEGLSYREILEKVPVAKSSLSSWLKQIGLSKSQKQRLTEKKLSAARRGSEARKNQRVLLSKEIFEKAFKDIGDVNKRELFLMGICLYWAEGHKQKENNISQPVRLGNSDPRLINIFLKWLKEICNLSENDIHFAIYLHETAKGRLENVKKYWSGETGFPLECFNRVCWKRNKINTKRKNIGESYEGLLDVNVRNSANLNRKITGWIKGICANCK